MNGDNRCRALFVYIVVRGSVTRKIYDIWRAQLCRLADNAVAFVADRFDISPTTRTPDGCLGSDGSDGDYVAVVLCKTASEKTFLNWSGQADLSDVYRRFEKLVGKGRVFILTPDWVVNSLKRKAVEPIEEYLHYLHHSFTGGGKGGGSPEFSDTYLVLSVTSPTCPALYDDKVSANSPIKAGSTATIHTDKSNHNKHITDVLEDLQEMYSSYSLQRELNPFKVKHLKQTCAVLKSLPYKLSTVQELDGLKHIGKSTKQKIVEIIETGQLKKLNAFHGMSGLECRRELTQVWGVGEATADDLIRRGFCSVRDLRERGRHLLNHSQLVGLDLYEDLLTKIPRREVEEIGAAVRTACQLISPEAELTICGSYRRGSAECGDVDVLIAPPPHLKQLPEHTLSELILSLERSGFLTHHLSLPTGYHTYHRMKRAKGPSDAAESTATPPSAEGCLSDESSSESSTEHNGRSQLVSCTHKRPRKHRLHFGSMDSYMGVCRCPGPDSTSSPDHQSSRLHRRIDIKVFRRKYFATALLYFTGPEFFNRCMRSFAGKKGYQLNEYGLRRCMRSDSRQVVSVGARVPCDSERDVFTALGLQYQEPDGRGVLSEALRRGGALPAAIEDGTTSHVLNAEGNRSIIL